MDLFERDKHDKLEPLDESSFESLIKLNKKKVKNIHDKEV